MKLKRRRRGRREKGKRRRENPYPYPNALFTSTDLLLPRNHLLVINLHYASFLLPPPLSPTILQPPPSSGRGIELPVSQEAGKVSVIVYYSSNGKAPQTSSSSTTAATLLPLPHVHLPPRCLCNRLTLAEQAPNYRELRLEIRFHFGISNHRGFSGRGGLKGERDN